MNKVSPARDAVISATGALVSLAQRLALADALNETMRLLAAALGAAAISVRSRDPGTHQYRLICHYPDHIPGILTQPVVTLDSTAEQTYYEPGPVHVRRDPETGKFQWPPLDPTPWNSVASTGLTTPRGLVGILSAGFIAGVSVESISDVWSILAHELALLLEHEQSRQELDDHVRSLALRTQATRLALEWPTGVENAFAELFTLELGGARTAIWAADDNGNMRVIGTHGDYEDAGARLNETMRLPEQSLARRAAEQEGVTLVWTNSLDDLGPHERAIADAVGAHTVFCCALQLPDQTVGLVYTGTAGPVEITPRGVANAQSLAMALTLGLQQQHLLAQARQSAAALQRTLDLSVDMICTIDIHDQTVRTMSPACKRILGYTPEEMIGRRIWDFVHPDDLDKVLELARAWPSRNLEHATQIRVAGKDGRLVWTDWRGVVIPPEGIALTVGRDISRYKSMEDQLVHQALHDTLTGLANPTQLLDRLEHALARSRPKDAVAVLYLDVDRFRVINDSLGYSAGDQVLLGVARRLALCLRPEDTAGRMGGDAFAVVLEDTTAGYAAQVAEASLAALKEPFITDQHEVYLTASIGIALGTPGRERAEGLLHSAEVAMYRAKHAGKAHHVMFEPGMRISRNQLEMEGELRRAIEHGELQLHYQPTVDLESGALHGMEALLRWRHPRHGVLAPGEFLRLAEDTGLILPIGQWVLSEACQQIQRWQKQYQCNPPLSICVNLSVREFHNPRLTAWITEALSDAKLEPQRLQVDILEDVAALDEITVLGTIKRLKGLGVVVAVDDFGTGSSSLVHLRRYGLDLLKVGRSFVGGVAVNPPDRAIISAVVSLAGNLHMGVVAEAVENEQQLAHLRRLGCNQAQGHYFAKPMAPEETGPLLASQMRW